MNRKFFNHIIITLLIVCLAVPRTSWANNSEEKETIPTLSLTISPAPEPREALKYRLIPGVLDQKPGNAALLYYTALEMMPDDKDNDYMEEIKDWQDMASDQLPHKEVQDVLDKFDKSFHYIELAAHRESCDWQYPVREEGFSMLMPALGQFRNLSRALCLKAHMQIINGQYDEALLTLQNGMTMSLQVGKGSTLIQNLVGIAMAALILKQAENFISSPDTPNLYWALTGLPDPFIDIRHAMEWEQAIIYVEFPRLEDLDKKILTPEEASRLVVDYFGILANLGAEGKSRVNGILPALGWIMLHYQDAKRFLTEHGIDPDWVDKVPAAQAVMLYQLWQFRETRDSIFKWFNVPYIQAKPYLKKLEEEFAGMSGNLKDNVFNAILPAMGRVHFIMTRMERDIAILRCVEAVRMYTAENDGRFPPTLADITTVPVPTDPLTGHDFIYQLVDGKAVIESPVPPDGSPKDGRRYELTLRK
ncbi:MAG: hypothetical protein JW860_05020 [Sedimentisphaerales bacterium]|nr:hypothetical protein [Sedimentisphaerales bacterium]